MIEMANEEQEHTYLMKDLASATKRAASAKYLEASKEFADQAYPLMQAITEHFGDRMTRMEEAMDAMIEQTDSFLQPELARSIVGTLELGKIVAGLAANSPDPKLKQAATAYLAAVEMTIEAVEEVTVASDVGEDEDEDED